jgi:hypothetical protein
MRSFATAKKRDTGAMSEQDLAGWNALEALARPSLKDLFGDSERLARYSTELELPGGPIRFDWSKTHLSPDVERVLGEIAGTMDLVGKREQLFAGARSTTPKGAPPNMPPSAAWAVTPASRSRRPARADAGARRRDPRGRAG